MKANCRRPGSTRTPGGKTELPSVALEYKEEDPAYLSVTDSPDSEDAPDNVKHWTAAFDGEAFQKACADARSFHRSSAERGDWRNR